MTVSPEVFALCDEFGIRVIPARDYPRLGEVRAVHTLDAIIRQHGISHARLVMSTLAETANNKACLDRDALGAASDLVRVYGDLVEVRAAEWLDAWDLMPVGDLQLMLSDLRGIVPLRAALVGMLHERLYRRFGTDQLELFDDRRTG